jgi:4-amino-4-deoxy-L-arabinose transferase-like glycosyltransferase
LFVGLGRTDVGHDEAIYTFSVDRILEIGDWLTPKSSPNEDVPFLEKPPLKFWIVAAPIRFGLLPHNEFGTRFWDALFGGVAFLYIFLVGVRLAGPICGAVALLVLFVHWPLLFDHGLRSNNMEAALFLSYCGGIFHFLEWARRPVRREPLTLRPSPAAGSNPGSHSEPAVAAGVGEPERRAWAHPVAVGLYFVLGFMTKFVAAIFLPMIIGLAALVFRGPRRRLFREWRVWAGVGALCAVTVLPWFAYANIRFGAFFWEVILTQHVYTRFHTFLNPVHVQPWSYYPTQMFQRFGDSGSQWLVVAGLTLLVFQAIRRRWLEGTVVVLWLLLPVSLISFGTSKLYHYAYPFLPPAALGAGYLAALVVMLAPAPLDRVLHRIYGAVATRMPAAVRVSRRPAARVVCLAVAGAAAAVAVATVIFGRVHLSVGETMLFKSSGVVRPGIVLLLFGLLGGAGRRASAIAVVLFVMSVLPHQAYRDSLPRLTLDQHPLRNASDCLVRLQSAMGNPAPGLYVDVPGEFMSHPLYYYFRRVRPWTRAEAGDPALIRQTLDDPSRARPMLLWDATYRAFMNSQPSRPASPPMIALPDVVLLLPGPYASCSDSAPPRHGSR